MHRLILNVRLLTLAVAVVALVLVAGSLAPRQTSAANTPDPSGVFCGYLTGATIEGNPIPGFNGTVLIRFDLDFIPGGNANDVVGTAVAYTSLTKAMPDCQTPQEPVPDSVPPTSQAAAARPTISDGKWDPATNTATWTGCNLDVEFAGVPLPGYSKLDVTFTYSKDEPTTKSTSTFAFDNAPYKDDTCTNVDPGGGGLGSLAVDAEGHYLDGPGGDPATYDSDWDKDGCLDWDELDPKGPGRDPFFPDYCIGGAVGGIAELPDVATTPLEAGDSSGSSAGLIAVIAAAVAAGAIALSGTAWYARKRWSSTR